MVEFGLLLSVLTLKLVTMTAKEIAFEDFSGFALKCLKFSGLEITPTTPTNPTIKQKVLKVLKNFYFCLVNGSLVVMIAALAISAIKDFDYVIYNSTALPDIACFQQILIKAIVTSVKRDKIAEVLAILKETFPTNSTVEVQQRLRKTLNGQRKFTKFFCGFVIMTNLAYTLSVIATFIEKGTSELAYPVWVPFSHDDPKVFLALNLFCLWFSYSVSILSFGMDLLAFTTIGMVAMNFDILSDGLETAKMSDLKGFVVKHQRIIELGEKLEEIFSSLFLYNFVQGSIFICLIAFELAVFTDVSFVFLAISYLIVALNQVFLYCYLGQKIIDSSLKISDAIYDCDWYESENQKLSKSLLIILARSQRAIELTAGKFQVVSIEIFTEVSFHDFVENRGVQRDTARPGSDRACNKKKYDRATGFEIMKHFSHVPSLGLRQRTAAPLPPLLAHLMCLVDTSTLFVSDHLDSLLVLYSVAKLLRQIRTQNSQNSCRNVCIQL